MFYHSGDVSLRQDVSDLFKEAKQQFGEINGIFHAAGVMPSHPFSNSNREEIERVLYPKIKGTIYLDEASQNEPLDFFVTFSSLSTELGDFGFMSYALANSFMDQYIKHRQSAHRKGISLTINWPYWQEGGMHLPDEAQSIYQDYSGFHLLETAKGLDILLRLLNKNLNIQQAIVTCGDRIKIERTLGITKAENNKAHLISENTLTAVPADSISSQSNKKSLAATVKYLKTIFSEETKIPYAEIDPKKELELYGIDSIMILQLNERLNADFNHLRRTLLFEYRTLESLADYLLSEQLEQLIKVIPLETGLTKETFKETNISSATLSSVDQNLKPSDELRTIAMDEQSDIAIIGLSGKYPKSNDLDELWNNLLQGRDCIEEIPKERWDYQSYYEAKRSQPGKTHSKWGGFIQDADKFDALFFNISPQEAEQIDPQERLMLEIAWAAIEDAGYNPLNLSQKTKGKIGVFVGVMWNEYQLLFANQNNLLFGNSNTASLANRISYVLNARGPSLVIDTACSSSLVAIHEACKSLKNGECSYAIAGGVNLSLHPSKYINMSLLGLLSTDGRCRSFGTGGDGYVPGEGVGAILLKSLKNALADHDHIYGVIKGTSTNHGGKTNGFTVPNPIAQAELISAALQNANIPAESISYIEAHGTGTALGEPIEITGLTKAFGGKVAKQSCAIGSVKSNVGHLEGAAGIVGVTKVLLQLKHSTLVPSLHSAQLNSHIEFDHTPFSVQRQSSPWEPKNSFPRRAGISSFGATGTNAHVLIEEAPPQSIAETALKPYYLLTFSAKTESALYQRITDLLRWLQLSENTSFPLSSIAYTLNTGRSHFNYRFAFVADSIESLMALLEQAKAKQKSKIIFMQKQKKKWMMMLFMKKFWKPL